MAHLKRYGQRAEVFGFLLGEMKVVVFLQHRQRASYLLKIWLSYGSNKDENFDTGQIVIMVMNITVNEWKVFIGLQQSNVYIV